MAPRKPRASTATLAATLLLLTGTVMSATPECQVVRINPESEVAGLHPEATGISVIVGTDSHAIAGAVVQGGKWRVTQAQFDQIKALAAVSDEQRRKVRLEQTRNGNPMPADELNFLLKGEADSRACGDVAATELAVAPQADLARVTSSEPATPVECLKAANDWIPPGTRYRVPVVFNSHGVHCYSPPVIRQGDLLEVGMVLNPGEKLDAVPSVEFTDCPPESAAPNVLANGELPKFQSRITAQLRAEPHFLGSRACGSVSPVVTVKLGEGNSAVSTPYTLTQYQRYRATFHLGALYTDLHNPDFALRNDGTSDVIYDKEANKRGPEYLAALIVPGVAYYAEELFEKVGKNRNASDPANWGYKGYDPIHDKTWKDKLGLVITAGIEDPGDRFGLGLSYEIAYGINLVGVYEMAKVKQLSGHAIGDPFTGTTDQIPTDKEWESKFSIGLTFDLAYVTKLFSGVTTGG
ncbi:MAG TPA: hypothetical protein VJT80_18745 [Steroidobacteraceae bacterium]|nr:hypothetical protein [Steroidobacteraceae bacterium]